VKERSVTYQSAPSPVPLTAPAGPSLPPRPGLTTYRLLVVDVNLAASLAYSRNLRRRMANFSPPPALSEYRFLPLSSRHLPLSHTHTLLLRRLSRLEGQYVVSASPLHPPAVVILHKVMQSQMIGLQTSLDRILAAVTQPGAPGVMPPGPPPIYPQTLREGPGPGYVTNVSGTRTGLDPQYDPALMQDQRPPGQRTFPPLPGFAPPVGQRSSFRLALTETISPISTPPTE